jgi:hypothetical protein
LPNSNYALSNPTQDFEIAPATVAVQWGTTAFTYTGNPQVPAATATGVLSENLSLNISGAETNAGTYTATASPSNSNYALSNPTQDFEIAPATVTVQWGNTAFTYTGNPQVPAATATGVGSDGDLTLTISGAGTNVGVYMASAGFTDVQPNYVLEETSATRAFTVAPKPQTITFNPATPLHIEALNGTYTLSATTEDGVTVQFRIDGSTAAAQLDENNNTLLHLEQSGAVTVAAYIDNANYTADPVSRTITVVSNNTDVHSITADHAEETAPGYFLVACETNEVVLTITPSEPGAKVLYNGAEIAGSISIDVSRPDIYIVEYVIEASAGSMTTHSLQVESRFAFEAIAGAKFNNVLYVNNNPATNGGYHFKAYEWFRDGQSIGTGQYYSAGNARSDVLGASAQYSIALTTDDGKVLHTCPAGVQLQFAASLLVYPNPARAGAPATLEYAAPDGHFTVHIYDVVGKLVSTQKLSSSPTNVVMPSEQGLYLVTVNGEIVKVVVQ